MSNDYLASNKNHIAGKNTAIRFYPPPRRMTTCEELRDLIQGYPHIEHLKIGQDSEIILVILSKMSQINWYDLWPNNRRFRGKYYRRFNMTIKADGVEFYDDKGRIFYKSGLLDTLSIVISDDELKQPEIILTFRPTYCGGIGFMGGALNEPLTILIYPNLNIGLWTGDFAKYKLIYFERPPF